MRSYAGRRPALVPQGRQAHTHDVAVYLVQVDVAYRRPPRVDGRIYYLIEADSGVGAELTACQWAACSRGVVMPVGSVVLDWEPGAA